MEKIESTIIFEIMGKPKEHVDETIKMLVEKLGDEKGLEIKQKKIAEPKAIEDKDLFTSFADVELELDSLNELLGIMFKYMPSHVEISSPTSMKINNDSLNVLFNELMRRLHQYDAVVKRVDLERGILFNRLKQVDPNFEKEIREALETQIKKEKKKTKKKSKK